jgi:hypothetical protein
MEAAAAHQFAQARRNQFLLARFEVQSEGAVCQLPDLLELLGASGRTESISAASTRARH